MTMSIFCGKNWRRSRLMFFSIWSSNSGTSLNSTRTLFHFSKCKACRSRLRLDRADALQAQGHLKKDPALSRHSRAEFRGHSRADSESRV
jgi:hypothetical protein